MTFPETPMYDARFDDPGAWQASDFAGPESWTYRLPPDVVEELEQAVRRIREYPRDISTLSQADFPAPSFARAAEDLRMEVESGRGFVVIAGLPIDRYSDEEATLMYWGIATHLATPIPQNASQDYLFPVRDEGYNFHRDYGARGVRISRTAAAIEFHTDSSAAYAGYTPDIVALLALQTAKAGGLTAIVSAKSAHNILRERHPEALRRLYRRFYFDRRAELRPGESPLLQAPVFAYDGELATRYFRFNLVKGYETAGVPTTAMDLEAIDALDSVARREELPVRFDMRRGEMQFVNNRLVMHSRTAFEDYAEPERRRHLVRLWLRRARRVGVRETG